MYYSQLGQDEIIENNFGEENVKHFLESKGYSLIQKISQDDFYIKTKNN